jgi:hypothetical protein
MWTDINPNSIRSTIFRRKPPTKIKFHGYPSSSFEAETSVSADRREFTSYALRTCCSLVTARRKTREPAPMSYSGVQIDTFTSPDPEISCSRHYLGYLSLVSDSLFINPSNASYEISRLKTLLSPAFKCVKNIKTATSWRRCIILTLHNILLRSIHQGPLRGGRISEASNQLQPWELCISTGYTTVDPRKPYSSKIISTSRDGEFWHITMGNFNYEVYGPLSCNAV